MVNLAKFGSPSYQTGVGSHSTCMFSSLLCNVDLFICIYFSALLCVIHTPSSTDAQTPDASEIQTLIEKVCRLQDKFRQYMLDSCNGSKSDTKLTGLEEDSPVWSTDIEREFQALWTEYCDHLKKLEMDYLSHVPRENV